MVTYQAGKPLSQKLGSYPTMSLKEARAKAREFWQDPKKFAAQAEIGTFKQLSENWLKRYVEPAGLKSQPEIERILRRHVYPKWEHRPFVEINRREVNHLLDVVADNPLKKGGRSNGGRSQADAVLATIVAFATGTRPAMKTTLAHSCEVCAVTSRRRVSASSTMPRFA